MPAATVGIAWRTEAAPLPCRSARSQPLVIAQWALHPTTNSSSCGRPAGAAREPWRVDVGSHIALGAGFAALFGIVGFLAQGRAQTPAIAILWSASAVLAPITILIALYYRVSNFERSIPFAGLALLLATLFGIATETLGKRAPRPGLAAATRCSPPAASRRSRSRSPLRSRKAGSRSRWR